MRSGTTPCPRSSPRPGKTRSCQRPGRGTRVQPGEHRVLRPGVPRDAVVVEVPRDDDSSASGSVTVSEGKGSEVELDEGMRQWIQAQTGADEVRSERRPGGASRVGWAVDATYADGRVEQLWLRS